MDQLVITLDSEEELEASSDDLGGLEEDEQDVEFASKETQRQEMGQSDEIDLDVRFRRSMDMNRVSFGGCGRLTIDEEGPTLDDNWNLDDATGELDRPNSAVPKFLQDMASASNGVELVQEASRGPGRPSSSFLADRSSIGSE
eukprot:CAMPEP_0206619622 /NCGR_PEP_ID=MMETSP0325_2-20121206/61001_1 /ASSEMBLY_ACC=CAM_ASM_000347 /TAXON_ID=2866 /ORGANISM="Crypthecodinium cohnii, Strain Seligo" /LENGTH=142 /DNA_ID=CAMNT_0054142153 /DNA_START=360 /DNA_END=785 /DNA_ORIENTATION=-